MKKQLTTTTLCILLTLSGCTTLPERDLAAFSELDQECYNRNTEPYTFVADTHVHFRPFGGAAIPFTEMIDYFRETGVLFVNVYGIGQILPTDSPCTYYLDCPGTPALPSIKNDFVNAANYVEFDSEGVHLTLSMTFPDLANPDDIVDLIHLYDKEYPGIFKWMGEVNLIKQALLNNHHTPATKENIKAWSEFMQILEERNIPISIHCDLGNDDNHTEFLELMEYVLELYPDNKIVWGHMGLSKELTKIHPATHIRIMKQNLNKSPNLMLDISWRVIEDNYFSNPEYRDLYVDFFNEYSDRILPGTDFVAARSKDFSVYEEELEVNSRINQYLDNEAFRNIALGQNYFRFLGLDYEAPEVCDD